MMHAEQPRGKPTILGRLMDRVLDYIFETNIYILTAIPVVAAILLVAAWVVVAHEIYGPVPPMRVTGVVIAMAAFIVSLSGLVQIVRREAPGVFWRSPLKGIFPVLSGTVWVAFTWTIGILLLIISIAARE